MVGLRLISDTPPGQSLRGWPLKGGSLRAAADAIRSCNGLLDCGLYKQARVSIRLRQAVSHSVRVVACMGMAGWMSAKLRRRVYMESNRNIDGVTERYVVALEPVSYTHLTLPTKRIV